MAALMQSAVDSEVLPLGKCLPDADTRTPSEKVRVTVQLTTGRPSKYCVAVTVPESFSREKAAS